MEALTVAVPNFLHHDVALAAIKAGKNVAVEKPLAITLEEANEMVDAAKRAGIVNMYTENLCFAPSYRTAKEIVDKGGLGNIYLCKAYESDDIVLGSEAEKNVLRSSWYLDPRQSGGGKLMSTWCSRSRVCPLYVRSPKGSQGARGDH